MNTTAEEKNKAYLKNEITAFEGRLAHIKAEIDSLKKEKESISEQVESIKTRSNEEVDKKRVESRKLMAGIDEERAKLANDRDEFFKVLTQFNQEKNDFTRQKQEVQEMRDGYEKSMIRVSEFIRLIRDWAPKL